MNIFVTGAAGKLGSRLVQHLVGRHDLAAYDRADPPADWPRDVPYIQGDLLDLDKLRDSVVGCNAVVHLGAIPGNTHLIPQADIFQINVQGTYHVLKAAAQADIGMAVVASSLCAIGFPKSLDNHRLAYLPVDEQHPCRPGDVYDLSKLLNEETAAMFSRTTGMTTICIRFPALLDVCQAKWFPGEVHSDRPRLTLCDYLDFADACRLIESALPRTDLAHEVVFANASTLGNAQPTPKYAARFQPALEWRGEPPSDTTPLINCAKARHLFNFRPEITWQQGMCETSEG